jgi:hypothetical protein
MHRPADIAGLFVLCVRNIAEYSNVSRFVIPAQAGIQ